MSPCASMRERLQHQDLDDASRPLPRVPPPAQETLQECPWPRAAGAFVPIAPVPGDEHPRQGDVLELAQVAEVVVDGQAPLAHPAQGLGQPALRDPHPRLQRRDGTHVGIRAPGRTGAPPRRAGRARRPGLPAASFDPRHRRRTSDGGYPATRRARPAPCFSAGSRVAASRSSRSRCSSLSPTYRSAVPQARIALLRRQLQRLLVGPRRLAETTLRHPDVRQEYACR